MITYLSVFCERIFALYEWIAARFSISVTWIRKLIRQGRETNSIALNLSG